MFVVFSTSAVPVGLRGELTRWLLEVAPGTFVGNVSARVRDALWDLCVAESGNGSVLLVHAARNEQRLSFRTHGTHWTPVDRDGFTVILRPEKRIEHTPQSKLARNGDEEDGHLAHKSDASGWSIAARRKRFRRPIEQRDAQSKPKTSDGIEQPSTEPDPPF